MDEKSFLKKIEVTTFIWRLLRDNQKSGSIKIESIFSRVTNKILIV